MLDDQAMHLLRILQSPKCNIWCINIGETYNISHQAWTKFAKGLRHTKVTHMYASEHTITPELKDIFREVIRDNRVKHNMHNDPNNLEVIVRCTHCWWNPINAKVLQPYIRNSGWEHILTDKATLGLKGTTDDKNIDTIWAIKCIILKEKHKHVLVLSFWTREKYIFTPPPTRIFITYAKLIVFCIFSYLLLYWQPQVCNSTSPISWIQEQQTKNLVLKGPYQLAA